MKHSDDVDESRRQLLIQALAAGFFSAGFPVVNSYAASIFSKKPTKLPPGQSIYRIAGQVTVNGKDATLETIVKPGDTIQTSKDGEIIFVVNGNNSMILGSNSHLVIETQQSKVEKDKKKKLPQPEHLVSSVITGLNLLAGRLLSVSRDTPMRINTATAVLGIRGTGFYIESDPELTYFCTCYGITDVASISNPASKETIESKHHDHPVYIVKDTLGNNIRKAPFINHTDQELSLIELLVGREPPYVFPADNYGPLRRNY